MSDFGVAGMYVFFVIGLVVAVLWLLLPFAVFGIKDRLDTLIRRVEENTSAVLNNRPKD